VDVQICDMKPGLVSGVTVKNPEQMESHKEQWYEYTCANIQAKFEADRLDMVLVKMGKRRPVFQEVEAHQDTEVQFYVSGTVIALFIDIKEGTPDLDTAQIVRIREGTCLAVEKGKGHFVPVSQDNETAVMVVTMPTQDFPHVTLPEPVCGI